jgi:hypothetical protein
MRAREPAVGATFELERSLRRLEDDDWTGIEEAVAFTSCHLSRRY